MPTLHAVPGHGARSKPAMTKAEVRKLIEAENEQARQVGMRRWYEHAREHIWSLLNQLGFPAHKSADEKASQVVATLLRLAGQIVAADSERDPDITAAADKAASDFRAIIVSEHASVRDRHTLERHTVMAGIVAQRIVDPEWGAEHASNAGLRHLAAPWDAAWSAAAGGLEAAIEAVAGADPVAPGAPPPATLLRQRHEALSQMSTAARRDCVSGAFDYLQALRSDLAAAVADADAALEE